MDKGIKKPRKQEIILSDTQEGDLSNFQPQKGFSFEEVLNLIQKDPKSVSEEYLAPGILLKEDFKCQLCLQLLVEPVECSKCETMYCESCIAKWN